MECHTSLIVTVWYSMWTHHNCFVKSLFYRWQAFGWFWFLATMDSVAVNVLIHVSGQYASLLGIILQWITRSKVGPSISRCCLMVLSKLVPIHTAGWGPQLLHPSFPTLDIFGLLFFLFWWVTLAWFLFHSPSWEHNSHVRYYSFRMWFKTQRMWSSSDGGWVWVWGLAGCIPGEMVLLNWFWRLTRC